MKYILTTMIVAISISGVSAHADIQLVDREENVWVVYRKADTVHGKKCAGRFSGEANRDCPPAGENLEVPFGQYVQNLGLLYHVETGYSDPAGLTRVSVRIETLERDLASGDIPTETRPQAEQMKQDLLVQQQRLIAQKKEVLDYLGVNEWRMLDARYHPAFQKAGDALYTLWAQTPTRLWRRGASDAVQETQSEICKAPWRQALAPEFAGTCSNGKAVRHALLESPIGRGLEHGYAAWAGFAEHDPTSGILAYLVPASDGWPLFFGEARYAAAGPNTRRAVFCVRDLQ